MKLIESDKTECVFNVCPEKLVASGEILKMIKELSSHYIEIIRDRNKFRVAEVSYIVGGNTKLAEEIDL